MTKKISILWFRQDLRLKENPAFVSASKSDQVLPIFILNDETRRLTGSLSKIWLHHSLENLKKSLNGQLSLYRENAGEAIQKLISTLPIEKICFNACYEPWHVSEEKEVIKICREKNILVERFNGNYLFGPEEILKDDKSYYKVFTAYKKKALLAPLKEPSPKPLNSEHLQTSNLLDLNLLPQKLRWHESVLSSWTIGEEAALQRAKKFSEDGLFGYKKGRDFPAKNVTSKLSSHLHFGEISPHTLRSIIEKSSAPEEDKEHFISELIWREFSAYLLYHFKGLYHRNFNPKFNLFPWKMNAPYFKAWKEGKTGYPIIDAGMRELWQTGYMHNRVRMIVASFLVKNLNIHWKDGASWFWDCLFDADLANNSASWQWVAGSGADAAPYFRIFNPITQGEKFDPDGTYTKTFVPELKNLPSKYLFKPWEAPQAILEKANICLGKDYPQPIVDLSQTRNEALNAYKNLTSEP